MIRVHEKYAEKIQPVPARTGAELVRQFDEIFASLGWDLPLTLATVYRGDPDTNMAIVLVDLPPQLEELPPWQAIPAFAMAAWRDPAVRAEVAPLFSTSFYGWLMMNEAWMLWANPEDDAKVRTVEHAQHTRTVYQHLDHVEVRQSLLATIDTEFFTTLRERGINGKPDTVSTIDDLTGEFPAALRRLCDLGARIQHLIGSREQIVGVWASPRDGHR